MKTSFFIRRKNESESYVSIVVNHNYKAYRFSTSFTLQTKDWEKGYPKRISATKNLRENLETIREKLDSFFSESAKKGDVPTPSQIGDEIKRIFGKEEQSGFKALLAQWMEMRQLTLEGSTIAGTERAFELLFEFSRNIEFDDINLMLGDKFNSFLIKKGNGARTINSRVGKIKAFLKWAFTHDFTKKDLSKYFTKVSVEDNSIIALTAEELKILEEAKLQKTLEKARDIFLFSAYTGLRYSDVVRFKKEMLANNFITMRQKKTSDIVEVPVRLKTLWLLIKYDYSLPYIANRTINKYLKKIFKQLELNRPIMLSDSEGVVPLYDAITFHVARKSFVTLALSAGSNAKAVQMMSGHKTDAVFNRYIGFSKETLASELRKMDY